MNSGRITKLNEDERTDFRQSSIDRKIRSIITKLNEVIDVVNQQSEPIYTEDFDDDELEEMIKGDDPDAMFTPAEAKRILADRKKAEAGRDIIE